MKIWRLLFSFFFLFGPTMICANEKITTTFFRQLESKARGRLGVYALNMANGKTISYRAKEYFPFCSTFKLVLVAKILQQAESNPALMKKRIYYTKKNILASGWDPVTYQHLKTGMTVKALCVATLQYSDNLAANLLLKELGGVELINRFVYSLGVRNFNLNRYEPELSESVPGDSRDTTTPYSMAMILQRVLFGNVLSAKSRNQLFLWMVGNKTGGKRIRAAVPKHWIVADKTGTGLYGTTNDVAILIAPNRKPIVMAIYFTQFKRQAKPNDQLVAVVAKQVLMDFNVG